MVGLQWEEVLLAPPNEAIVMADAPHVISDDEDIDSAETNVESAVSNHDSVRGKKKNKDVNKHHPELSHTSEGTL